MTTFDEGMRYGKEIGRMEALKEITALHDDPDSVERMSYRLLVAENIVDWVVQYFDFRRKQIAEGQRPYAFNGHIEYHAREQVKLRETK